MARKLLITLLAIALVFETGLTCMAFFARHIMLGRLGASVDLVTDFLGYLIAWFLMFVSLICAMALYRVIKKKDYMALCYLLGFWWVGIGLGIYFVFKKPDNLLTDTLKGLLLIVLTWWSMRKAKSFRY